VKLVLPSLLAAQIGCEAQTAFPRECCGLIEGVSQDGEVQALALYPAPNRAGGTDFFEIDPATHLAAQRTARANGHVLVGCYHSHPNGRAEPSQADRMGAGETNFIWVIAGLHAAEREPELRAYCYSTAGFGEIGVMTGADLVTSSSKDRY
jgi:proteasome lid subunit RPN8/RPN11